MTHEAILRAQLAHVRAAIALSEAMERLTEELTRDRSDDQRHPIDPAARESSAG